MSTAHGVSTSAKGRSHGRDSLGILCREEFSGRIRRERERSDRSREAFSLALFDIDSPGETGRLTSKAQILKNLRSIDEVGWMGERSIGVLLPATCFEGARLFADRVSAKLGSHRIFTYPDNWIPEYKAKSLPLEERCLLSELEPPAAFNMEFPLWKRCLDIVGSLAGLILLSPLFIAMAVFIKVVSPGPAFFRQPRVGKGGKLFTFIKFRTMKTNNDAQAHREHIVERIRAGRCLEKLDDCDPRIIPGGRFLRKSCLDELPQLINVLRGDMSLVGPRPCVDYEAQEYLLWHVRRFDAVPGMTGLWQVSGKNRLSLTEMIRLDIAYESHLCLANDIKILLRTVPAILSMLLHGNGPATPATAPAPAQREKQES